ncbi:MAG TPA: ATP-binding protein [Candidatus Nitrosotalea sp.]|nr:ATP-binding protein [Candidatus Nitrosotalea sp.]
MIVRSLSLTLLLLAACAAATAAQTAPADPPPAKSVLLLLGGPIGQPASTAVALAARATLVSALSTAISIETEHVDLARFDRTDDALRLRELFRLKHNRTLDAIIVAGPEPLQFLLRFQGDLWPGVPVVVCDVDERTVAGLSIPPGMAVIPIRFDFEETIRAALELLPATRRVALVGGASTRDRRNNDRVRQAVQAHGDRLELIDLTDLSIEVLMKRLSTLPEQTIVVASSYLADGTGRRFFGIEVRGPMANVSNRPMFTVFGTQVGRGVVGGFVVDPEAVGQEAGELTLRVLRGEPISGSPRRSLASSVPVFDWRQLRRWGLDEARLPRGSKVLYREPTLWAQYGWHVAGAIVLLAAESALIAGLLIERHRRRRAQADLDERLRFEMLLAEVSTLLASVPVASLAEHIRAGLRRIALSLGVERATLWQIADHGQAIVPMQTWTAPGAGPPPSVIRFDAFPYLSRLWEAKEVYSLSSPDELPAEAAEDRRALEAIGVQSMIVIPLSIADRMLGALMFVNLREERPWPQELVRRLQMLGEPFASVLARRQAETALETSEAFTRAVLAAPSGEMAIVDGDGGIVQVNEAWARAAQPLTAMPPGANYLQACHTLIEQGDPNARAVLTLVKSVLGGQQGEGALEYPSPQVDEDRWFEIRVRRLERPAAGAAITHIEITPRKRAEASAKRHLDAIAHMDRVAAMGELASSFAHELNQPLTAILSNAQAAERFLALSPPDLEEFRACLHDIIEDDRRAGEVIRRMRQLLRKEPAELQPLNLNDLVKNVVALILNDAVLRNVSIELHPAPALPSVEGDPIQIQQVILNLLSNGIVAATDGSASARKVTVWTAPAEKFVELVVHDSGKGIAEDHMPRLFEPFFTTKTEGLGMGLAISRSIIDAHGGEISAENDARGGATFRVRLPLPPGATL